MIYYVLHLQLLLAPSRFLSPTLPPSFPLFFLSLLHLCLSPRLSASVCLSVSVIRLCVPKCKSALRRVASRAGHNSSALPSAACHTKPDLFSLRLTHPSVHPSLPPSSSGFANYWSELHFSC